MQKRGQITTFIIIGIVILAIVAFFLYLRGETTTIPQEQQAIAVSSDILPVQMFVQECVDTVSKNAVYAIGLRGGYYKDNPTLLAVNNTFRMPYVFENLIYDVPTNELVQKELSLYAQDYLDQCLGNFSSLSGITVKKGETDVTANLAEKKVDFTFNIPLSITKADKVTELNKFNSQVDVDLFKMLKAAREFINLQRAFPNEFAHGALFSVGLNNNLSIESTNDVSPYHFDSFVITFFDNAAKEEDKMTYMFSFALKFTWSNATANFSQTPLAMVNVPAQILVAGEPFYYQLNITGDGVTYKDNTDLFNVNSNGSISFTPKAEDTGMYYIVITATDKYGNVDFATFTADILKENTPPSIESIPAKTATVNQPFTLQINASDKDGALLDYSIENPAGDMEIDYNGIFSWTPAQTGQKTVNINVSDGRLTTKANFKLTIQ